MRRVGGLGLSSGMTLPAEELPRPEAAREGRGIGGAGGRSKRLHSSDLARLSLFMAISMSTVFKSGRLEDNVGPVRGALRPSGPFHQGSTTRMTDASGKF